MKSDDEIGELLPFVIGRCGHEPPEGVDGPAVCDTCAAVVILLEGRVRERREEHEIMH